MRADTTGAAVTSGRDSSSGAQLEGQGQGCSQRSSVVFRGEKKQPHYLSYGYRKNFTVVSEGFFKEMKSILSSGHVQIFL